MEKKLKDKKKRVDPKKIMEIGNMKIDDAKKFHIKNKPIRRGMTIKEIREERVLLGENIAIQFEKFRRRTGLRVTYCEYDPNESKEVFLAIEDI